MEARAWLWAGALIIALPAFARAESATQRAAALFKEGRAAMQRDDYAAACPKFEESAELDPVPGTILNLALCQEALGQLGQALTSFRVVLAMLPPDDERVPFAQEHVDALAPRVPRLKLTLADGVPAGATVLRDGEEIARADLGVDDPVNPGAHEVTLRVPGEPDQRVSLTLAEGERRALVLGQRAAPAPEPLPLRTIGFAIGGVGVASLIAGGVTGALVLDKKATVDESCHGTSMCDTQEGVDAASAGSALATISTITFIAGAALTGAGVALVLTSDEPAKRAALGPAILPGGGGLVLRRRF
ncbi:MAG: tetratricopeptide repeat protein [Polyangiaceae bacterium]|nr:tetratricopeptide repeat protein [Polyangiaceae bacterium]